MHWNGHTWEGVDTPLAADTSAKRESRIKRLAAAALEASLITALTFGLIAGTAFAAKGGGGGGGGKGGHGGGGATTGGSGTLTLRMVSDADGNGAPNWGDTIRFDVSTSATTEPHVSLTCSQGGTVVYSANTGYYASYPWPWTNDMSLASQSWTGGAASCTAVLQAYSGTSVSTLGSLSFSAGA
jgi:hypothetical protein